MSCIYQISHNIVSSLGFNSKENYNAVVNNISGLKIYPENSMNIPEAFCASVIDNTKFEDISKQVSNLSDYNFFDKLCIYSAYEALQKTDIDPADPSCLFILSTTKGNIDLLENHSLEQNIDNSLFLWHSANIIGKYFNNPNKPIVVSNACISGVSAQIVAKRLLNFKKYNYVVVIGADLVSRFVVSGFQSFKALSPELCLPFDAERKGLNIGEAAATIIYGIDETCENLENDTIILDAGTITNDANHISGPSRTAEGLTLAINKCLENSGNIKPDFISAHGTATPYNDDMEALAFTRCKLENTPAFSLKGYFGHTLGAAGLLETIISSMALKNNMVIKSAGYSRCGVDNPVNIISKNQSLKAYSFIKTISGFGGCNAAILIKKLVK